MTLRTFFAVAIPCPPALRPVIRSLGEMGDAIKPVSSDGLHITLKFLGETPAEQVSELTDILQQVIAEYPPFDFDLVGLGAFPRVERPEVVWAGVETGEKLIELASRLEERVEKLGYRKERRAFTPHLTLARVRRKPSPLLSELFDKHASTRFGKVKIERTTLFQSELTPTGAVYSVLAFAEGVKQQSPGSRTK